MKLRLFPLANLVLGFVLFCVTSPAEAATKTSAQPAAVTNRVMVVPQIEIPQSVFSIPTSPKDGRNPFFPQSPPPPPSPPIGVPPPPPQVDASAFVLNGITSPPKRTAMINARTFEVGEEGEVRLPNGTKELIKCEQIKSDSAIILIHGERRELRLRSGL